LLSIDGDEEQTKRQSIAVHGAAGGGAKKVHPHMNQLIDHGNGLLSKNLLSIPIVLYDKSQL
jgi:hypothetical protein